MRKIKGNRGVSILIALFVFLLAALTGTAVLTMSTANAGRFTHVREDQQRYLSVESAVQLLREELKIHSVRVTVPTPSAYYAAAENGNSKEPSVEHEGSALFGNMNVLSEQCKEETLSEMNGSASTVAEPQEEEESRKVKFTLKVKSESGEDLTDKVGEVTVTLTFKDMDMVFEIRLKDGSYSTRMTVRHINSLGENGAATYHKVFRWDADHAQIEQIGKLPESEVGA